MAEETLARPFEIANVITRTFEAIGANAILYFGLALLLSGIPGALTDWWDLQLKVDPYYTSYGFWSGWVWGPILAGLVVLVISNAVLQASLTRATVLYRAGETPRFNECLALGLSLFLPLLAIGLFYGLGLILGLMLLIVPGIFLFTIWAVVVPVFVQERTGIAESFSRSAALTRGARGRVFVTLLLMVIAVYLLSLPAALLGETLVASGVPPIVPALLSGATTALGSMFSLTLQASIYVELREAKEGVGPAELEAIFA